jgi:hypothetical protein
MLKTARLTLAAFLLFAAPAVAQDRTVELISGSGANTAATFNASSADGSRVFFTTNEAIPNAGDGDAAADIYMRQGTTTTLITPTTASVASFDGISADGSRVFFHTTENLGGDADTAADVYQVVGGVYTLLTAGTTNTPAIFKGASADGTKVFFETTEALNADGDSVNDVYRAEGGMVTNLSGGGGSFAAAYQGASADGSVVFFSSNEQLGGGDNDGQSDVFQNQVGTITQISGSAGDSSTFAANSTDGSRAFFTTTDDVNADDPDGLLDTYRFQGGVRTLITPNTTGDNTTFGNISADGSIVYFSTFEALAGSGDGDNVQDVYKREGSTTTLMSAPNATIRNSSLVDVSADGSQIVFSTSENIGGIEATDTSDDLYRSDGPTRTLLTGTGDADVTFRGAAADGSLVFFTTTDVLATGDSDSAADVYVADGNTINLVSTGTANTAATYNGISLDGSSAFFSTTEAVPGTGDQDAALDVYAARTAGASTPPGGDPPGGDPPGGDPPGSTPDTTPPAGNLASKAKQPNDGAIEVQVECTGTEACQAAASGTLKVPSTSSRKSAKTKAYELTKTSATIAAGSTTTLKLKIPKKAAKAATKALKAKKSVSAQITVKISDAAGNSRELTEKIKLKK